jgi:hypothetical protein
MAGALVGLVIAGGIVYGAVRLTHVTWGQPPAAPATPTAPASPSNEASTGTSGASLSSPGGSASPASSATPAGSASGAAGAGPGAPFTLTAPRSAGAYSLTSPMSATVKAVGSAGATQLITTVKAAGGTTSGSVSGQYLIAGDQYLGYTGYNGTFTPSAVLQAFAAGATGVTAEPAGSHGGQLACGQVKAASPSAMSGEACVWATTSTVAVVEFYGGGGSALEAVAPAKAGADALQFRAAVEAARS